MIRAAGIIFFTNDDEVLLLLRSGKDNADYPKTWCFPGGSIESDESAEEAAVRECREEIGSCPDGERFRLLCTKRPSEPQASASVMPSSEAPPQAIQPTAPEEIEFTTFVQFVDEPFDVTLNDEHLTHLWCNADDLPLGMHPGAEIAIKRLRGNELDLARMMANGDIDSPQRYQGMWLFDMRITGTGTSYRDKLDEYVYRPPELYLTQDFVDRCGGLPVIIEHPQGKMTNSEYHDRNIGAIMLPYIQGDEVRGVARINDDVAATMMIEGELSTSPAVYFRANTNTSLKLDDGGTVLIEGKPSVLEHLAICPLGVWDKDGNPSGLTRSKTMSLTKDEKDALFGTLKNLGERFTAVEGRLDSIEAKEGNGKGADVVDDKKDSKRKDSDDKDDKKPAFMKDGKRADGDDDKDGDKKDSDEIDAEDKKLEKRSDGDDDKDGDKKDSKRKDSGDGENEEDKKEAEAAEKKAAGERKEEAERKDAQRRRADDNRHKEHDDRFAQIERFMTGDEQAFATAQLRADSAYTMHGKHAPGRMLGETLRAYKIRLLKPMQEHSPSYKNAELKNIADPVSFDVAENMIYQDSIAAANSPQSVDEGELREIVTKDRTGRNISRFIGEPKAWMGQFMQEPQLVVGFNKNPGA